MSKRKPARTIKARSASEIRSKPAGSGQPEERANSKQAWVLALLCGHERRRRCAPFWPPWCARGSGPGWNRRSSRIDE
jgi:hypothetical protein